MTVPVRAERAFILSGGLGTRLRAVLPDRPKVLAPVDGRAFLDILIARLVQQGLRRFVLLLGHRSQQVVDFVRARRQAWPEDLDVEISVESQPLGTAGALKLAGGLCDRCFFLLNGDTYLDLDIDALLRVHHDTNALVTLAGTTVEDAGRYGRLEVSKMGLVERFREKDTTATAGLINGGVYLMERAILDHIAADVPVSLEKDVFPALLRAGERIAVSPQTGAFFDIGTPVDYQRFVAFCRLHEASSPLGVPPA